MKVMTRFFVFLVLTVSLLTLSSAAITVHKTFFTTEYFSGETINGTINLSIDEVEFTTDLTSSFGDSISLEQFLDNNGASYTCDPADCSNGYETVGSAATSKALTLAANTDKYFGFYVTGGNVRVTGFDMNFSSNFGRGTDLPLELEFFEDTTWKFSKFSNVYSSRDWGCYSTSAGSAGPLIKNSEYCQLINLTETAAVRAGVKINTYSTGEKNLRMNLYPSGGGFSLGTCTFDASVADNCTIAADTGETFAEDTYEVCVSADNPTNYKLYEETSGDSCGFVYDLGPESSVKDYAVFAQTAQYENATVLDKNDMNLDELISQADAIVEYRYDRNCSNGCVIPIRAKGVSQTLTASDATLDVIIDGEDQEEYNLYELDALPAVVDFEGILDLYLTGFKASQSGQYKLTLDGETLLSTTMSILPSPVITGLTPLNPPAGIPITFTTGVDFAGNQSALVYEWDFGDGLTETTSTNKVEHTYAALGNYTLELTVSAGDLSSTKSFKLDAISPKEALNSTLKDRQEKLNQSIVSAQGFPAWYQQELITFAKLDSLQDTLASIEQQKLAASTDEEYLQVAKDLYALDIPLLFISEKEIGIRLADNQADINPLAVAGVSGGISAEYLNEYKKPILNWQGLYMDALISTDLVSVIMESGEKLGVVRVYHLDITSTDDTGLGYFVIEEDKKSLVFNGGVTSQESQGTTIITLEPNQREVMSYYKKNDLEPTSFFASPRLNTLVIEAAIDTSCNYNLVCEEGLGEDWKTCRSDCKPVTGVIILSVIALFIVLVIYILMQLWYKHAYEKHLFGDRKQLFNLLNYIHNAKARGLSYDDIEKELRKQGWSAERTTYATKKARGKNTGLPEIIPFSKIGAKKRRKQAQEQQAAKQTANTGQTQGTNTSTAGSGARMMPRRAISPGANRPKAPIQRGRPLPSLRQRMAGASIATGNQQQQGRNINKSGLNNKNNSKGKNNLGNNSQGSQGLFKPGQK